MKQIYLDNAATTKIDEKVVKAMLPYLKDDYGNASSQHLLGRKAKEAIENSRKIIAKSINSETEEIIFTSGGTESNNLALKGLFFWHKENKTGKNHIITTKIEHDSILNVCKWLEKEGVEVTYLNVDKEGLIDLNELRNAIKENTFLVSAINGNNEIGTLQDINEIGKICKENNVAFHIDACQSYTKTKLDVVKQNISLMTINSHKIHGPKGVGALYRKKEVSLIPLFHGGGHEKGMRSGTENVASIVGFGEAVKITDIKNSKNIGKIRDYAIKKMLEINKTKLNGPSGKNIGKRLCNNINISFSNIEGEAIAKLVEEKRIMISTGSACASNTLKKSHVLRAIGLNDLEINSSVRISLSKFTTKKEIDYFVKELKIAVEKLRKMSPYA